MAKKTFVIAGIVLVALIGMFSACTLVVSHERESLVRAVESGSTAAHVLVLGANFWARYYMFCIFACLSVAFFVRRILMEIGAW